jgi:hypothetical protein
MAKPERRDPAKEAFWRRMLLRFGRSKSTVRDFCFAHELSEANFYAWRREIARRDREAPGSSAATARSSAAATSPVFVNVHVPDAGLAGLGIPNASSSTVPNVANADVTAIEVILSKPGTSGRRRLLVWPGFDAESLKRLLPLLESDEPKAASLRESADRGDSTGPEKPSC